MSTDINSHINDYPRADIKLFESIGDFQVTSFTHAMENGVMNRKFISMRLITTRTYRIWTSSS